MARITILSWALALFLCAESVWAQPRVVTALVHSDETYVVGKNKKDVQQYSVGDTIYLVLDGEKKQKNKYRVTFDPTNLKGDGWISQSSVRILSNYHSSDGKLPKEYNKKYKDQGPQIAATSGDDDFLSGEMTFIDELVTQEQSSIDQAFSDAAITPDMSTSEPVESMDEANNPFDEDLEFLFNDDPEFNEAFTTAKNETLGTGPPNIAISGFLPSDDKSKAFADEVYAKFKKSLMRHANLSRIDKVEYAKQIDTPSDAASVSINSDVSGAFFGVLSSKVGKNRMFKIKYFNPSIKQFESFEKVVNLPLKGNDSVIESVAKEAAQYLNK